MTAQLHRDDPVRGTFWTFNAQPARFRAWGRLSSKPQAFPLAGVSIAADLAQFGLLLLAAMRMVFLWPFYAFGSKGVMGSLGRQALSAEFWLGLSAGLLARLATKRAIEALFAGSQTMPRALAGFVACAGAGFAAAVIVHLSRVYFANRRGAKRAYFGVDFFVSAVTGLFGGVLGGFAANLSAMFAESGSVAIGMATGGVMGAVNSLSREETGSTRGWTLRALQGAAFGAISGVMAGLTANIVMPHVAMATTILDPNARMIPTPPPPGTASGTAPTAAMAHLYSDRPVLILPDACKDAPCMTPSLGGAHGMIRPIGPMSEAVVDHRIVSARVYCQPAHHVVHAHHIHHHHHHHHHAARHHVVRCYPHHIRHHAVHVAHHLHRAPPQMIADIIILPEPPPMIATVPIYVEMPPPPPLVHIDPCDYGNCAPPCATDAPQAMQYPIDVRGPCAQPGVTCVENLSFNDQGDARVTLEPDGTAMQTADASYGNQQAMDQQQAMQQEQSMDQPPGQPASADRPYYWNHPGLNNPGQSDTRFALIAPPLSNNVPIYAPYPT